MCKFFVPVLFFFVLMAPRVYATDGSGWQIVAQMTEQTKILIDQLEYITDQVDLVKILASRDESSLVGKISQLGSDVVAFSEEIGRGRDWIAGVEDDPFGLKQIEADIDQLESGWSKECSEGRDVKKCWADKGAILAHMKRINWIAGSAKKALSNPNVNVDDAGRITAEQSAAQTLVLTDLLNRLLAKDAEEIKNKADTEQAGKANKRALTGFSKGYTGSWKEKL